MPAPRPAAGSGAVTPAPAGTPSWTILLYGHADHGLAPNLLADVIEMTNAELGDHIRLLVYADWNATLNADATRKFPTGSFLYQVRGKSQGADVDIVSSGPELDFDDPAVLAAAVETTFTRFKADRYGLILWDHGGGWSAGFGGDTQDGLRPQSVKMPVEAAAAAIKSGLARAGLPGSRPLEFVAFDACLMAGVETITPFAELGKVFLGPAELDYGAGWDYAATFSWLSQNPGAAPRDIAAFEVQAWDAHHRGQGLNDQLLRSHVAIDTAAWTPFAGAARALTGALRAGSRSAQAALALQRGVPGYKIQVAAPGGADLRDVGDILAALAGAGDPAVAELAGKARQAAAQARIAAAAGRLRQGQLGVHVFAGAPSRLAADDLTSYPRLARGWNEASGWGELLNFLRGADDLTAPRLQPSDGAAAGDGSRAPEQEPVVSFEVSDPDAAQALFWLAEQQPDNPRRYRIDSILGGSFIAAGRYDYRWKGSRWRLPGADGNVPVTVMPWVWQSHEDQLQTPILSAPGMLRASFGQQLPCVLIIDGATGQASSVLTIEHGRPDVTPLADLRAADPALRFVPTISMYDVASGAVDRIPASEGVAIPPGGTLRLAATPAPAGHYGLIVEVSDAWGNQQSKLFPM